MFEEALKSDDCVAILCNCMKNLEEKMNGLFQITSSAKDSQIESKLQLKDLNKQLTLHAQNLTSMGKKEKEEKKIIKNFEENVSVMSKRVENLEKEIDKHEQYCQQNCLLVYGMVETDDEVTDSLVIKTISTKMNIEISPAYQD